MALTSQALIGLALLAPLQPMPRAWQESPPPDNRKLRDALVEKTLRAGEPVGKMLDLGVPTYRRKVGPFTEYNFELIPGYSGLSLLAKDGRLRRAGGYDCLFSGTYFDDLRPEEVKEYKALSERYDHVPADRCIGRLGWHRPPRWLWDLPAGATPGER